MPVFETLAVHAGVEPDPLTGAVMTPVYQTSTYAQEAPGVHKGYEYSRTDNPTRTPLQTSLAALEGGNHALVFASGLSATDAVLNTLSSGDHILAGDDLYGGTYRLFSKLATHRGLQFSYAQPQRGEEFAKAITPKTKLVWIESPTNPMLNLANIRQIAEQAHSVGAKLCVDNTFMSPYFQNPLQLGADLVMHSMTKYINGHSDVVMGCLVLNDTEWYSKLKFVQNAIGAVPAPWDCFLALRGIKTLALRMQRHNDNAMEVAKWLVSDPRIERVIYPGLTSHPQHDLAKQQCRGFGGMITFFPKGGLENTRTFLTKVKMCALAESLGGVETLIEHPAIMTHASVEPELRKKIGIADNLVRISVGIEGVQDIINDLDQALGI